MFDFALNIIGNDWIMIVLVALVLLLGTKRLPDATKKLARVMAQYDKTKNMVQEEIQKAKGEFNINISGPVMSERQKLETLAKSLGVNVEGKTDDDLRNLVDTKLGGSAKTDQDTKK
ncbi:MAG TPA: translocase [Candidatus Nitrosotalea sp.]|nr:twin-arginine translocase TatA/TatE family subunit [Candidatus Nitrosotalea sp.]HET7336709.1 translocase [Candidatus Nitrosotalea sp.]